MKKTIGVLLAGLYLAVCGSTLAAQGTKAWMGDWALTIQGGRGPQELTLTVKEADGKAVGVLAGGRGGDITINDVAAKDKTLTLKWKQQGRGGEVDATMTLEMAADNTLKVTRTLGENKAEGTGKKK
jgi:hypothetical protein